jgi:CRISPR system Cascade subunit CasD
MMERDFQTTQNVPTTLGTGHRTIVSERYYLADAVFLVVLEGDGSLLTRVADAVERPRWRLSFGRRAFVPARPLVMPGSKPVARTAEEVLAEHAWLESSSRIRARAGSVGSLRTVVECPPGRASAEIRHDHPISFARTGRLFTTRNVVVGEVPLTESMIGAGGATCT